ncbi:MAG TPA: CHRD domain-containing protein, partial [Candidatus Dormibacteraeota bacterium]
MLKSVVLFVVALMGVMLLPAVVSANDVDAHNHFVAHLTAAQEVPAVASTATGEASFTIADKDTAIRFRISSRGLDRILQSHIHVGARGANGPVFVFL